MYHTVTDFPPLHVKHLYPVKNKKEFINDLGFFLKYYKPISAAELIKINRQDKAFGNYFHLSFDDGFSECYDIIAPVLLEKGIPATFFLNPAFIDNKALFYKCIISLITDKLINKQITSNQVKRINEMTGTQNLSKIIAKFGYEEKNNLDKIAEILEIDINEYLVTQKPYLTNGQIKSLISKGFTVGAHSYDHPRYYKLTLNEQVKQTRESLNWIVNSFGVGYKLFAFPFTDYKVTGEFFNSVKQDVDLSFGTAGLKKDPVKANLQRLPMESGLCGRDTVYTEYFYYLLKAVIGKNKIIRN